MAKIAKKMKTALEGIDREKLYTLEDAVKILKGNAGKRKFDETIEIAMNLGVDPRHADQNVRGMVSLPHGTGAVIRVAVLPRMKRLLKRKLLALTSLVRKSW